MTIELTLSGFIDLLLRGATFGILLLVIAQFLRRPDFGTVCLTGLLFGITGLVEIILNSPTVIGMLSPPGVMVLTLQQMHFIALWWFVLALFDDRFVWHPTLFWPVAVAVPLVAGAFFAPEELQRHFKSVLVGMNVSLLALIIYRAMHSRAGDLVDERRSFSLAMAFTVPPFTLFVFIANLISIDVPFNAALSVMYSTVYFLLALGFCYWLTTVKEVLFQHSDNGSSAVVERGDLSAADRLELDRVVKAMDGGLYLEPGLNIGGLADVLSIPEHRLRRLINGGLGYRNFAAFVNDYRIREAKRRLSDPDLAREQIIQHAFSLGYASLAPFNRAFRERVGVSPTEYREAALDGFVAH